MNQAGRRARRQAAARWGAASGPERAFVMPLHLFESKRGVLAAVARFAGFDPVDLPAPLFFLLAASPPLLPSLSSLAFSSLFSLLVLTTQASIEW